MFLLRRVLRPPPFRLQAQCRCAGGAAAGGGGGGGGGGKPQRIERIVSNRGVGSRTEVATLIKAGRVKVNGKVVRSGALKFPLNVDVQITGLGAVSGTPLLAAFHKPTGMVSTMSDDWERSSLAHLTAQFPFLKTMHPVGRLDADTSGLLLFCREGALTQRLLHPSSGIVREYEALVLGDVDAGALGAVLRAGVRTSEGVFPADLLAAEPSAELVPLQASGAPTRPRPALSAAGAAAADAAADADAAAVADAAAAAAAADVAATAADAVGVAPGPGDATERAAVGGSNKDAGRRPLACTSRVTVGVAEGKYRMVRRVLHNAGHSVVRLHRVCYGGVRLGDLQEGQVRRVEGAEDAWAQRLLAGGPRKAKRQRAGATVRKPRGAAL
jgi:23S rRNA pseudouridine2605 synthase